MKYILLLLIALFSVQSYAVDSGDWWLQRQIQIGDGKNAYGKNVIGQSARAVMESVPIKDSTREEVRQLIKRSIAVDKPTPTKVGGSMLKRLYSPQAVVGTAAVSALLGAIGWIMEDGVYVKRISIDADQDGYTHYACPISVGVVNCDIQNGSPGPSAKAACQSVATSGTTATYAQGSQCLGYKTVSGSQSQTIIVAWYAGSKKNPDPEKTKVTLTPVLLGAAMLGKDYKDPDPNFDNDRVNTGDYTSVKETYEHDPSGVGNELAKDMDEKLKNAKPTNKPSYVGDPEYDSRPLADDDNSSDRAWDEKGDEATGGTEQEKDPETGEATGNQSITIQFPLFCSWASSMCKWYDDWQASDKVHQKFEEDVKNHQSDEKSFWQKIEDWFDWTKEEPEPQQPETPQVDDQGIFSRTFDTAFSLSSQCPPDIPVNFESTYISGNFTFSMNWLCIIFSFMAYPLVFLSHCVGIWILYEAVIQKEIKW